MTRLTPIAIEADGHLLAFQISTTENRERKRVLERDADAKTAPPCIGVVSPVYVCKLFTGTHAFDVNARQLILISTMSTKSKKRKQTRSTRFKGAAILWKKKTRSRLSRSDTFPVPDRSEIHAHRSWDCESYCKVSPSDVPYRLFCPGYQANGPLSCKSSRIRSP